MQNIDINIQLRSYTHTIRNTTVELNIFVGCQRINQPIISYLDTISTLLKCHIMK